MGNTLASPNSRYPEIMELIQRSLPREERDRARRVSRGVRASIPGAGGQRMHEARVGPVLQGVLDRCHTGRWTTLRLNLGNFRPTGPFPVSDIAPALQVALPSLRELEVILPVFALRVPPFAPPLFPDDDRQQHSSVAPDLETLDLRNLPGWWYIPGVRHCPRLRRLHLHGLVTSVETVTHRDTEADIRSKGEAARRTFRGWTFASTEVTDLVLRVQNPQDSRVLPPPAWPVLRELVRCVGASLQHLAVAATVVGPPPLPDDDESWPREDWSVLCPRLRSLEIIACRTWRVDPQQPQSTRRYDLPPRPLIAAASRHPSLNCLTVCMGFPGPVDHTPEPLARDVQGLAEQVAPDSGMQAVSLWLYDGTDRNLRRDSLDTGGWDWARIVDQYTPAPENQWLVPPSGVFRTNVKPPRPNGWRNNPPAPRCEGHRGS